jgi:hypothetical protein
MDRRRTPPLLLTLPDYERIFRVVHGVVGGVGLDPNHACTHINACAAYILNKYYRVPGKIVAGAALLALSTGPRPDVAAIGGMRDGQPFSDLDHFHMWIQTSYHAFDFQAPVFGSGLASQLNGRSVPPRMFQRRLADDCEGNFQRVGDFSLHPSQELTEHFNEALFQGTLLVDMVNIIDRWFAKPPKAIGETIKVMDSVEGMKTFRLSPVRMTGSWGNL